MGFVYVQCRIKFQMKIRIKIKSIIYKARQLIHTHAIEEYLKKMKNEIKTRFYEVHLFL